MKHQDLVKYHQQTVAELQANITELEKKFTEIETERRFGKGKNVHAAKLLRHDIARLKTILSAKLLVQSTSPKTKEKAV